MVFGGLGVSRGMAWTMRTDSLEVWRDLVLHGPIFSWPDFLMADSSHGRFFSWPILLFLSQKPWIHFFWKSKKTRTGKWSKSVKLKVDLVNYDAIWCQIGSPFLSQFLVVLNPKTCGHFCWAWRTRETFPFFSFFIFQWFPMDFPWISHRFFHGFSHGFCIGFSMDFPWIDFPWFVHELQNVSLVVSGTPPGVRKQSRHRHIFGASLHIGASLHTGFSSHRGISSHCALVGPARWSGLRAGRDPMGGKLGNPWTNPGFSETHISAKGQGLKTSWPFFIKCFKFLEMCIMFRYWIFDAAPAVVVLEFFFWKEVPFWIWENIEKITNGILRI